MKLLFPPLSNIVGALLLLLVVLVSVSGQQGCTDTCPPLNFGTPVPALCEGDKVDTFANINKVYSICHGGGEKNTKFSISQLEGKISVFANFYTGCNAGRRESGVFAHVAQRFYDKYGENIVFVQSIKGGGTCQQWADMYQRDATQLYPTESGVVPKEMPWSVDDVNYEIRDDLFTSPFGHPSYVILDENLKVRHKFIGPCCGYESYFDCTAETAKGLDEKLTNFLEPLIAEAGLDSTTTAPSTAAIEPTVSPSSRPSQSCNNDILKSWSDWSPCSTRCSSSQTSTSGIQFRYSTAHSNNNNDDCETFTPVEVQTCQADQSDETCNDMGTCISDLGSSWEIESVVTDLNSPRDVDFHPTPGLHLGNYSEGRTFHADRGLEAWIVNGGNHSISIVASLGTQYQTTLSRRDRGYYHYMINGTAISFNKVRDSQRTPDRDSYNYWAICNDNLNTYLGKKEANYFMGPTLYNSDPKNRNTVNRKGETCQPSEPCYFLHADMLHESPACIGITHDPEIQTAYGTVYWAFDATGNRQTGQLVRFDFQQPHGPGSMDHATAAVRRYVEVELERGPPGVHAGMVVHPTRREVYIAVPGGNKILKVGADSGSFARTAREEYPIFSNRLPSFEYSIWECVDRQVFAGDIQMPTGMALSEDGERLFVAERQTGKILVYEIDSGALLLSIQTKFSTIGGMAVSPSTSSSPSMLYFVDEKTNSLNRIKPTGECTDKMQSFTNPEFSQAVLEAQQALGDEFSLTRDYGCQVDPVVPDAAFFDQVHLDGYADDDPNVQSNMTGMDAAAALLANRTDCGLDSDLNFDALLLGGYFCHRCLPEQNLACDQGGLCSNVQWLGYVCDNEFTVSADDLTVLRDANGTAIDPYSLQLYRDVTYRFTVNGNFSFCASISGADPSLTCATNGPLILAVDDSYPTTVRFLTDGGNGEVEDLFEVGVADASKAQKRFGFTSVVGTVIWAFLIWSLY